MYGFFYDRTQVFESTLVAFGFDWFANRLPKTDKRVIDLFPENLWHPSLQLICCLPWCWGVLYPTKTVADAVYVSVNWNALDIVECCLKLFYGWNLKIINIQLVSNRQFVKHSKLQGREFDKKTRIEMHHRQDSAEAKPNDWRYQCDWHFFLSLF